MQADEVSELALRQAEVASPLDTETMPEFSGVAHQDGAASQVRPVLGDFLSRLTEMQPVELLKEWHTLRKDPNLNAAIFY